MIRQTRLLLFLIESYVTHEFFKNETSRVEINVDCNHAHISDKLSIIIFLVF